VRVLPTALCSTVLLAGRSKALCVTNPGVINFYQMKITCAAAIVFSLSLPLLWVTRIQYATSWYTINVLRLQHRNYTAGDGLFLYPVYFSLERTGPCEKKIAISVSRTAGHR
jgi:hypothetical protein